jgi:archaellum component FlaC
MIDPRLDNTISLLMVQIKGLRKDINSLNDTLINFTKGVKVFVDQQHVVKDIHRDLLSILRSMVFTQSEIPGLLNGIVGMASETMAISQQIRDDIDPTIKDMRNVVETINKDLAGLLATSIALVARNRTQG